MKNNIMELLKNDLIEIDSCFAMHPGFSSFIERIEIDLMTYKKKIIVNKDVVGELYRHVGSRNKYKKDMAGNAIGVIFLKTNIFEIHDENVNDNYIRKSFADAEFISSFSKKRLQNKMALLTNDQSLGKDINQLNHLESCYGKKITVFSLNDEGLLQLNIYDDDCPKKEDSRTECITKDIESEPVKEKIHPKSKTDWLDIILPSIISVTSFAFGYACRYYEQRKNY